MLYVDVLNETVENLHYMPTIKPKPPVKNYKRRWPIEAIEKYAKVPSSGCTVDKAILVSTFAFAPRKNPFFL